jgi:hypothetical protein
MVQSVLVTDSSKMIVPGIGVAALAVGEVISDRVVVVALNASNVSFLKQWKNSVRMRAKGAQVAQTKASIHPAVPHVPQGGLQSEIVAVNPAKNRNAAKIRCPVLGWKH